MNVRVIYCSACGKANAQEAGYCYNCGKTLQTMLAGAPDLGEQTTVIADRSAPKQLLHGRYMIVSLLGRGGMGAVYKAEDTQFGNRPVAIKEMNQSGLTRQEIALAAEQFKQEALLLANLNHPNLPSIYDHFSENERWYLVMDFIDGVTLEKYVSAAPGNALPPAEVLNIGIQLARVLSYLHTRPTPIIFRDLKPLNVMITPDKSIYLIDFGIARLFKERKTRDTVAYVSTGYASPEQFGEAQTTPQSDIYSLGAMLHRLLSGNDPRSNLPLFTFKPLQAYNLAIPPSLTNLVARMLASEPAQRPASMASVRQELEAIQQAQEQHMFFAQPSQPQPVYYIDRTTPSLPLSPPKKPGLPLPIYVCGTILLVGLMIAGVLFFNRSPSGNTITGVQSPNGTAPLATTPPSPVATSAPTSAPTVAPTSAPTVAPTSAPVVANTPVATAIPYPSYSDAENDIKYYYVNESDFKGKNIIQSFDSLTYQQQTGPVDQPQFMACAEYKFASVSSPDVTADTARHTFTFQYGSGNWSVIDMGNWNSC